MPQQDGGNLIAEAQKEIAEIERSYIVGALDACCSEFKPPHESGWDPLCAMCDKPREIHDDKRVRGLLSNLLAELLRRQGEQQEALHELETIIVQQREHIKSLLSQPAGVN